MAQVDGTRYRNVSSSKNAGSWALSRDTSTAYVLFYLGVEFPRLFVGFPSPCPISSITQRCFHFLARICL